MAKNKCSNLYRFFDFANNLPFQQKKWVSGAIWNHIGNLSDESPAALDMTKRKYNSILKDLKKVAKVIDSGKLTTIKNCDDISGYVEFAIDLVENIEYDYFGDPTPKGKVLREALKTLNPKFYK